MADNPSEGERLLFSAPQSERLLGISERRFHELRREPGFPAAVLLGARCVRYHRSELATYAKGLPRVTVLPEPKQLRAERTAGKTQAAMATKERAALGAETGREFEA